MSHFRLRFSVLSALVRSARARNSKLDSVKLLALSWNSMWYSITETILAHTPHQPRDHVALRPPLILCGFWRSGTTYLHELLANDTTFSFPNTDACLNPALLLLPKTAQRGRTRELQRPMDGLPVRADSPQEDEFALMSLGLRSAYRAMLFPSLIATAVHDLDPSAWPDSEQQAWCKGFLNFLCRLTNRDPRRLLLKSPTHTFKIDLLAKLLPNAQFIILLRDPCEVWASNERMWQTMFNLHTVERNPAPPISDFLAQAYRLMADKLGQVATTLPPERFCFTTLEDLTCDPVGTLRSIYEQLSLPAFDHMRDLVTAYLRRTVPLRRSTYNLSEGRRKEILAQVGEAHLRLQALAWRSRV